MSKTQVFTFGDPVPMSRAEILDYVLTTQSEGREWYEPPVSFSGIAKTFRAGTHHASAIYFKRNVLASMFIPHKRLTRDEFSRWALDTLLFGNGYLERERNGRGVTTGYKRAPAKHMRRLSDLQRFVQVSGIKVEREFEVGSVHHLMEYDINQEVYGLPEYLGALHSVWLNESATLFRRRYFENGSHAGFIMYVTDPAQKQEDIDELRQALQSAKGPGNFRNLFYYAPQGKKDGIQLIPISEVSAQDDFLKIKNISRDDMLAAHRVPPQLLGIVPSNTGGFGAADKADLVFMRNEIVPLQDMFSQFNEWADEEVVTFKPNRELVQP